MKCLKGRKFAGFLQKTVKTAKFSSLKVEKEIARIRQNFVQISKYCKQIFRHWHQIEYRIIQIIDQLDNFFIKRRCFYLNSGFFGHTKRLLLYDFFFKIRRNLSNDLLPPWSRISYKLFNWENIMSLL